MFYLRTDGAERYALVLLEYEGSPYYLDIQLKDLGDVNIQVWWINQGFSGSLTHFES